MKHGLMLGSYTELINKSSKAAAIRVRLSLNRTQVQFNDSTEDAVTTFARALGGGYSDASFAEAVTACNNAGGITGGLSQLLKDKDLRAYVFECFRFPCMRFKIENLMNQLHTGGQKVSRYSCKR
jgi:hypothetical protein